MTPPLEYIDVLTPYGKPTGQSLPRKEIHARGLWHRTVHVWMVTSGKDILLQKRARTKTTHPGLWDMACAGHIAAGESSMEAALKELREELGVDLIPEDLTFLFTMDSEFIHNDGRYIDREFHDIYLACKDFPLSSFTLQADEVEAVRYVSINEFSSMVRSRDTALVPHFTEYGRFLTSLFAGQ